MSIIFDELQFPFVLYVLGFLQREWTLCWTVCVGTTQGKA